MPDQEPKIVDGRRVLGIVPGVPPGGERKVPEDQDLVMVWPHLIVRHAVVVVGVFLVVLVISLLFDAPLRDMANPTLTPNPEKAPWYFAAVQELLSWFHPMVAGVLFPGAVVMGLIALPYVDRNPRAGIRFRKVAVTAFTIWVVLWIVLTIIGFAFRGPNWEWVWPWDEWHGEL